MADGSVIIEILGDDSKFKDSLGKLGGIASGALGLTTKAIGAVSAGLTAAAGYAVKVGSDFEAGMSKVQAISGASASDMEKLSAVAKEMGSTTKFSATESAEALSYMAMAGWKTDQMVSGLPGIMNLAAASGEDLASVSDIVTDALTAFGLQASDSAHFADVLAQASSSSNTNVGLMGETFKYVAPLAGAMGYSVEDTAVAIGLMANAGIKGGQAGTALRSMFTRLAKPPKDAAAAIEALGLQTTDASGKMLPLSDVMGQLREKFAGLSEEQQIQMASSLAGQEAMSGLLAIVNASDGDFDKLTSEIADADGAAQAMADTMNDNLQGAVTIAQSALEGLGISVYEGLQEPLKEAVQTATEMLGQLQTAFNEGGLAGMLQAAGDVAAQLVTNLANAAPQMIDAAVALIQSFLTGIQNNLPELAEGAVGIVTSLVEGIFALLPQLGEVAIELIAVLAEGLAAALPNLLPAAAEVVAGLYKGLSDNSGELISAALDLIDGLAEGLLEAIPILLDAAPKVIAGLVTGIIENIPKLIEVGLKLIVGLATGILKAIPKLVLMVPKIIAAIVDNFIGHDWAGTGVKAIEGLLGGILGMVSDLLEAGKSLLDAILHPFSDAPSKFNNAGKDAATGLSDGLKSSTETAKSSAKTLADGVGQELKSMSSETPGIGENVASGLAKGIQNGKSAAVNAATSLADSVLRKTKDRLGIHSPSKVMRDQVGKFIPQGMEAGIEGELPHMEQSVAEQMAGFTDKIRAAVEGETLRVSAQLAPAAAGSGPEAAAVPPANTFTINVYPGGEMGNEQAHDVGREIGAEAVREMRRRGIAL